MRFSVCRTPRTVLANSEVISVTVAIGGNRTRKKKKKNDRQFFPGVTFNSFIFLITVENPWLYE